MFELLFPAVPMAVGQFLSIMLVGTAVCVFLAKLGKMGKFLVSGLFIAVGIYLMMPAIQAFAF